MLNPLLLSAGLAAFGIWLYFVVRRYRREVKDAVAAFASTLRDGNAYLRYLASSSYSSLKDSLSLRLYELQLILEEHLPRPMFFDKLRAWKPSEQLEHLLSLANIEYSPQEFRSAMLKCSLFAVGMTAFFLAWNLAPNPLRTVVLIPLWLAPLVMLVAVYPFISLFSKLSKRAAVIERDLPFVSLLITIATMLKASLSAPFSAIEQREEVWGKGLATEAKQFRKYARLLGDLSGARAYAETQPNRFLRNFLRDYVLEARLGGDLGRFCIAKLREAREEFARRLESRANIAWYFTMAVLCFVIAVPIALFILMMLFAAFGEPLHVLSLLNVLSLFLVGMFVFGLLSLAKRPHSELSFERKAYPCVASLLGILVAVMLVPRLSPTAALYAFFLAVLLPFAIFYIISEGRGGAYMRDIETLMRKAWSSTRLGKRALSALNPDGAEAFSKPFSRHLRSVEERRKRLGVKSAFDLATSFRHEDSRKAFAILEFASRTGVEDAEVFEIAHEHFAHLRSSIRSYRARALTCLMILALSTFVFYFAMKMMFDVFVIAEELVAGVLAFLPLIQIFIALTVAVTGFVTDMIATGTLVGGARGAFINTLIGFALATAFGFI